MLGPSYRWLETDTGWYLQYHYGTAAYVRPDPERGGLRVVIHWNGREIRGTAASLAQGKIYFQY